MQNMVSEFKAFIQKGDVVTVAVGLILALYFQHIVDAVLLGVINPVIAAIFGERSFERIGFDVGDARISIGLVIDAVISFVLVGFVLFLMVRAYNNMKRADEGDEEEAGPSAVDLLTEIRDSLANR